MTPKQREFARHYAMNPDAQAAALAAGYSKQYAKSNSGKLLENQDIVHEIQRLRQRMNERAEKSATDVVNEYSKIAFLDRWGFLKPDPDFPGHHLYKSPEELTDEQRSICLSIKPVFRKRERIIDGEKIVVHRQEWDYRLADKESALLQMGRHFGIFDDKLKLTTGSGTNPFANATPQQLEKLRRSFVGIMSGDTVDGEYKEVTHMLPNGEGHPRGG